MSSENEKTPLESIPCPIKNIPVTASYDVFVAGAGMAGVAAAVTAARSGLRTCLVEYFGKPGGIPVSGALGVFNGFDMAHEHCVKGFAAEVRDKLNACGGFPDLPRSACDPEKLSTVLLNLLNDAGVTVHFYTQLVMTAKQNRQATHAVIASKSGLEAVSAKIFIDASGDGDLSAMLDCPYTKGRESDGLSQSATLVVKLGGVDSSKAPRNLTEINQIWTKKPREVPIDHTVVCYLPYDGPFSAAILNMTHVLKVDGTKKEDLTRVRIEGTKQASKLLEFFKNEVPGFEHAYIDDTGMQIGIRETRHIIGDYVLTEEDVVSGRDFDDTIARGGAPIDIHNPDKPHGNFGSPDTVHRDVHTSYGIPYRCITPKSMDNLFVVGRSISATHMAVGSTRYNAICMALGQSAGSAAALVMESKNSHKIDISRLQKILRENNAILERTKIN